MEIEFTNFTFAELDEAAKGYRNRALEFLSRAAREINNYAKSMKKSYDLDFYCCCFSDNSEKFVFCNVYDSNLQFHCFRKMELAKKERHKLCKKFTNKIYIKC